MLGKVCGTKCVSTMKMQIALQCKGALTFRTKGCLKIKKYSNNDNFWHHACCASKLVLRLFFVIFICLQFTFMIPSTSEIVTRLQTC